MLVNVALKDGVEQVDVCDHELFCFPGGMVGFGELTRYALFQLEHPLFLLQSVDDPHVGFVLLDPFRLDPCYRAELQEDDRALLELEDGDQPVLLCVVTLSPEGSPLTANLRAPVAVNPTRMLGSQVILLDNHYPVRHPITRSLDGMLVFDRRSPSSQEGHARANGELRRARSA